MRWLPALLFLTTRSIVEVLKILSTFSVVIAAAALAFLAADQASTHLLIDMWNDPLSAGEQLGRLGISIGRTEFQSVANSPSLLIALLGLAVAFAVRVLLGLTGYALWKRTTPAAKQQRLLSEMDQALQQAQSA